MQRCQSDFGARRIVGSRSSSRSCNSLSSTASGEPVVFEIRDGNSYCVYAQREQLLLLKAFSVYPGSSEVWLGHAHVVRSFDRIEAGGACQVNVVTNERRHVRIRPASSQTTPRRLTPRKTPRAGTPTVCDECCRLRLENSELQDIASRRLAQVDARVREQRRLEEFVANFEAEQSRLESEVVRLRGIEHEVLRLRATCEKQAADLRNSGSSTGCTEAHAIAKVAELFVRETGGSSTASPDERRKAQRKLIACLHPDKCPAPRLATQLVQELQACESWTA